MSDKVREISVTVRDKDVEGSHTYVSCSHCHNQTFYFTGAAGNHISMQCTACNTPKRVKKCL